MVHAHSPPLTPSHHPSLPHITPHSLTSPLTPHTRCPHTLPSLPRTTQPSPHSLSSHPALPPPRRVLSLQGEEVEETDTAGLLDLEQTLQCGNVDHHQVVQVRAPHTRPDTCLCPEQFTLNCNTIQCISGETILPIQHLHFSKQNGLPRLLQI